ncbi:MAG TPA: undecaprenyldiphospho-muramoylpentapeptide beta-N-acetylglucosaminyltransferase [Anaerolineales bacterium]
MKKNGDHIVRLLICAGGTGGGVYPALAVYQALGSKARRLETLWVGGEGGMEAELVKRAGIPFQSIPAAGLHGVGLRALPRNASRLARGAFAARRILLEFRPDVLFFTGGYIAGPLALASRTPPLPGGHIPTLLYVPDIEPGVALKSLAYFADRIAVSADESRKFFRRNVVVTGYPVRPDLAAWTRASARAALGISDDLPVLLVFGGSKGARSINQAVLPHVSRLLRMAQVIHLTGQLDWDTVQKARDGLTEPEQARYHAFPYLHEEMGAALAAADLAVSRAGASSLGELPLHGVPALLVPYPYAWRYQKVNADYLAERGAAVILPDELLNQELLVVITDLLENPAKRRAMQAAMQSLARPSAAQAIADQLMELGGQRQ